MDMISSCFDGNLGSCCDDLAYGFRNQFHVTIHWQDESLVLSANIQGLRGDQEVRAEFRNGMVFFMFIRSRGGGPECLQSFQLPSNVNVSLTTTSINNGVLTVIVPAEKQKRPKKIKKRIGCFGC